jgi:hypothetical protein
VLVPSSQRERGTQGVDVGLATGWLHRRLRLGGELRYAFLGAFDTPKNSYRTDLGPYVGGELFRSDRFTLILGSRSLFSRAGTYRREEVNPGYWLCRHDTCTKEGVTYRSVPFVAFYGFSAAADVTLALFSNLFVRVSYVRTRWFWNHDLPAPAHQAWWHVTVGLIPR